MSSQPLSPWSYRSYRSGPQNGHLRRTVAANIDRGIRRRDLTNRAVGDLIGSTEHQVWRWRVGRHLPIAANLAALANVLYDGDLSELYAEPESTAA